MLAGECSMDINMSDETSGSSINFILVLYQHGKCSWHAPPAVCVALKSYAYCFMSIYLVPIHGHRVIRSCFCWASPHWSLYPFVVKATRVGGDGVPQFFQSQLQLNSQPIPAMLVGSPWSSFLSTPLMYFLSRLHQPFAQQAPSLAICWRKVSLKS